MMSLERIQRYIKKCGTSKTKTKLKTAEGYGMLMNSPAGVYKSGSTLYIAGTGGKDGSLTRDIMDDLLLVPTRNVKL